MLYWRFVSMVSMPVVVKGYIYGVSKDIQKTTFQTDQCVKPRTKHGQSVVKTSVVKPLNDTNETKVEAMSDPQ